MAACSFPTCGPTMTGRAVPITSCSRPQTLRGLKALLTEMLGVHRIVKKCREIWLHENVRIHLDAVEGLGAFMELEAVYDGSPAAEAEQQKKVAYLNEGARRRRGGPHRDLL